MRRPPARHQHARSTRRRSPSGSRACSANSRVAKRHAAHRDHLLRAVRPRHGGPPAAPRPRQQAERACASATGACTQSRRCSRRARSSSRSCSRRTTCRASCSPAPRASTPTATASPPAGRSCSRPTTIPPTSPPSTSWRPARRCKLVVDCRGEAPADLAKWLRAQGVEVRAGSSVVKALGAQASRTHRARATASGHLRRARRLRRLATRRASLVARPRAGRLRRQPAKFPSAGVAAAAAGDRFVERLHVARSELRRGDRAIHQVLAHAGRPDELHGCAADRRRRRRLSPEAGVPPRPPSGSGRQWLDLLHDVTVADAEIALAEGYEHIEHLKRYTTCGMAADQGKTSNLNALLAVAEMTAKSPAEVGTTTFRPPYTPVALGALAGRQLGARLRAEAAPARARGTRGARRTLVGGRRLDAPRLLSAQGRDARAGRAARGSGRARRRRRLRRLAARQDRSHRPRLGEIPRPLLRQQCRQARGRPGPLRPDAQRERRRHRRRHRRAARPRTFRGHDDQRRRGPHRSLARGMAAVRMAGPAGLRHAGDDPMGHVRHRRTARAPAARAVPHGHRLRLALDAAHEPARGPLRRRSDAAVPRELFRRARL